MGLNKAGYAVGILLNEMTQLCPLSVDVFYTKLKLLKLSAITIWLSKIPNCGKLNVNLHRGGETALCNE